MTMKPRTLTIDSFSIHHPRRLFIPINGSLGIVLQAHSRQMRISRTGSTHAPIVTARSRRKELPV
jgi:hypothetical protein